MVMSYVMKVLKQPLMIGYIITGLLVWPQMLWVLHDIKWVAMFSHLGVALLLFMVGIGLNTKEIKEIGKPALLIWLTQVGLTIVFGWLVSLALWYSLMTSLFIWIALSFSSTIIIVKLLGDKWLLDDVFWKLTIGILIVQDMLAMLLLILLSSLPGAGESVARWSFAGMLILKLGAVIGVTYFLIRYILPRLVSFVAQSQEFLLVFAIGRCLLSAAVMEGIWFSLEIWALIAGLSLSSLPYRFEIASKTKPLRDFFIVLFFVSLGSQLDLSSVLNSGVTIIILSIFVLVMKPLLTMLPMRFLHYKGKTSFLTGTTLAQVSEFSFILIALLVSMKLVDDPSLVSVLTMVGLITIAGSSYYTTYADKIVKSVTPYLGRFETKYVSSTQEETSHQYDIVVFGNHRTGKSIVDMLIKNKKNFVIVDYDPKVIERLEAEGLPCRYGDASDSDTLTQLHLDQTKMVVSTVHDYETNALILQYLHKDKQSVISIMSSHKVSDAELLYNLGANYVIVPHVIGGHHTAMMIEQYEYDIEKYTAQKLNDYSILL
jgi:Kef-type K+ transport system membrane component KefB